MKGQHRPLIGITPDLADASWDVWKRRAVLLPVTYHEQVAAAGGLAAVLPPQPEEEVVVERIDGLVLSGGGDIDPRWYGAPPHPLSKCADRTRDDWEMRLTRAALAADLPILGICRGMQLLNVARAGTLVQHLPDKIDADTHLPEPSGFGRHPITVTTGSHLYAAVGGRIDIATHHHQAVEDLGTGVMATAWAEDGVIEAIELRDRAFVCGVQGHPEEGAMSSLFEVLVNAAHERRSAQPSSYA